MSFFQDVADGEFYDEKAYKYAMSNTKYNSKGKAVVAKDDEWLSELEWDNLFDEMKKESEI